MSDSVLRLMSGMEWGIREKERPHITKLDVRPCILTCLVTNDNRCCQIKVSRTCNVDEVRTVWNHTNITADRNH